MMNRPRLRGRCSVNGCHEPEEWHTVSETANYLITVRYCDTHLRQLAFVVNGIGDPLECGTIDPELSFKQTQGSVVLSEASVS